jgi:hypothetical protein
MKHGQCARCVELAAEVAALKRHAQRQPTPEQIEPILDDFLGVYSPHYEELRKRCAQRIVDLYAVILTACPPLNKKARCSACNLLEPCGDPSCPNATVTSTMHQGIEKTKDGAS